AQRRLTDTHGPELNRDTSNYAPRCWNSVSDILNCPGFVETARPVRQEIFMNNKSKRFSPEFRERAARMVLEEENNHLSW
ncbi:hypothetical protein, partial [Acetobacter orientalis]|uniref:hypothetical protein n=1 Tax=Acetobacter orientalis TaxID=146474 RepID=UPI0039ED2F37